MADKKRELEIVLSARDEASSKLRNVGKSASYLNGITSKIMKGSAVAGTALVGLGVSTVGLGTKLGFSAARVEELELALNAIAKASEVEQKTVDATVGSLRNFNISHEKALQVTSLFIQSQLDLADASKLAGVAKDLAVISAMDSSEATETLTEAIASQEPTLLRQFGIVKNLPEIYEDYANKTGKAGDNLTELEKKQAFLNTILEAGGKVTGTYDAAMGSVSKQYRSLTGRIIPDLTAELGKVFSPALSVLVGAFSEEVKQVSTWLIDNKDKIAEWGDTLKVASEKVIAALGKMKNFIVDDVIPQLKKMQEWFEKNEWAMDSLKGFIFGVLIVAFAALATTIWTVVLPALGAMLLYFAPFIIAGGIFAAVYAFLNFLSKRVTGFTLFEQLGAAVDLLKIKFEEFMVWIDDTLGKIDKFLGKSAKAGKVGGGGGSFQHGGFVDAPTGQAVPAMLHGGERVIPRTGLDSARGGTGSSVNINFSGPVSMDSEQRVSQLANKIIDMLGRQNELAAKGISF